jgi:hypothetical protein
MAYDPESVRQMRLEKDQYFALAGNSPIPEELRRDFRGLRYFPYDTTYRVHAIFRKYPDPVSVTMITSKGTEAEYIRYGFFEFELDGTVRRLQAYKQVHGSGSHEETLFTPFRDRTSGKETYAAARYLDIVEPPEGAFILDFNVAYNPYCAYSPDYICPFPPRENTLEVEVRAGEMKFKD